MGWREGHHPQSERLTGSHWLQDEMKTLSAVGLLENTSGSSAMQLCLITWLVSLVIFGLKMEAIRYRHAENMR